MPMRFFIKTHWESRNMRTHHALGHLEKNRRVAFASLRPCYRFDIDSVGDKIRLDDPVAVQNTLTAEVALFTLKTVAECIRVVQYEVFGTKQIEN